MSTSKKTLIAYFSCTGTTSAVASALADVTDGDLFEIIPEFRYTAADLNWNDKSSRSSVEMNDSSSRPAITSKVAHMDGYDTVFVGFPIWWYTAPHIIATFLESYDFSGKTVIPFATSGGSGMGEIDSELSALCPKETHWKPGKRFGHADCSALKRWVDSLHL